MKRTLLILITVFAVNMIMAQSDEDKIKDVINSAYVDGIQNKGSLEAIDKGFHPCFNLIILSKEKNKVRLMPIYTWRESVKQFREKNPDGPEFKTECKFLSIDITGDAAVAKIELYAQGKKTFTDYLSLYNFPEGWKIVNKTCYRH